MGKTYGEWKGLKVNKTINPPNQSSHEDSDEEEDIANPENGGDEASTGTEMIEFEYDNQEGELGSDDDDECERKVTWEAKKLTTYFNPEPATPTQLGRTRGQTARNYKEVKFIAQVLMTMGIPIKLPITVRVDNMGAIFMAENLSSSARMKHVDLRVRFITQYVEEKFIKINFVKSAENLSGGFTKNVTGEIFEKLSKAYVAKRKFWENTEE